MDFTFSPEAADAAELAAQILRARVTTERQQQVEASGNRDDEGLWAELAEAGLLSLHLPEDEGGAGLGLLEACRVLVEIGRVVAPVAAAPQVAGSAFLQARGESARGRVAIADAEELSWEPARPSVTASASGDEWRLDGVKTTVRAAHHADLLLVTAATGESTGVFAVAPDAQGLQLLAQHTSDGDRTSQLRLDGVPARAVGGTDGSAVRALRHLVAVTTCAELLGVTEGALHLTAAYATQRQQFGRPIGTFQGVRHRLADGHIDLLGQRLTLWQAAWRVQEGLDAEEAVAIAALWAADAAHRIAHTTVHVHGGVGIDLDGEAHRFFTAAKRFELALGGTTRRALDVGRSLAAG